MAPCHHWRLKRWRKTDERASRFVGLKRRFRNIETQNVGSDFLVEAEELRVFENESGEKR